MSYTSGISVIIPTYNRLPYLYGTLSCLLSQEKTHTVPYEIIIIDSGNNSARSLIKQFQTRSQVNIIYKKIHYKKNRSYLRNVGVHLAKFENICFLDNDILVSPDFINICYNKLKNHERQIILGCRKSLTNFKIENICIDILLKNFRILENLGYYNDERLKTFTETEPWRFVFSHTLCMKKSLFYQIGEFNTKFGKNWGFEDLELGFRLQLHSCNITLATDIVSYHQPHFSQSYSEQSKMKINGYLFLKLHNCFEVELYQCFYTDFDKYYPVLLEAKKEFVYPTRSQQKKYDLIFGCIFSSQEMQTSTKMFLGSINYNKDASKNKILINDSFFSLPDVIQQSIVTESFRIGKQIYIETQDTIKITSFTTIASKAGIIINPQKDKNATRFIKIRNKKSNIYILYIPSIFEPEKRFVFLWLANYLTNKGYCINLKDIYSIEKFSHEDFSLPSDQKKKLESHLNKSYGQTDANFIIPTTMLLNKLHTGLPNSNNTYIINDASFENNNSSIEFNAFNKALHFDDSIFSLLSFVSMYSFFKDFISKQNFVSTNSFCCFMENGFYEDSLDIILNTFSIYVKEKPCSHLTIKIPDYTEFENTSFPLHNKESKKIKLFTKMQTSFNEEALLANYIQNLNLEKNVSIIKKNLSIIEIFDFINKNSCVINISRCLRLSPTVYASILLKKKTIICSHHKLLNAFTKFCIISDSQKTILHKELHIPSTDTNIMQNTYTTTCEKLLVSLKKINTTPINNEDIQNTINEARELFHSYIENFNSSLKS